MIYEFNHVGVLVRDLDATMAFYRDLLGARLASEAYIPASSTDCVYVQLAGGLIEFLRPRTPRPDTRFGLDHIAFLSDDLEADFTHLTARGAPALTPPKVAGSGRGRLAFVADPSGVRVELLQRIEEFRRDPPPGPIRAIAHVSVTADDLGRAEDFYRAGLRLERRSGDRPDAAYVGLGEDTLELRPSADAARVRELTLTADDPESLAVVLSAGGATVGQLTGGAYVAHDPDNVRLILAPPR